MEVPKYKFAETFLYLKDISVSEHQEGYLNVSGLEDHGG